VDKLEKLRKNLPSFARAYDFHGAFRTSNMLDRLMQRMDRTFSPPSISMVTSALEISVSEVGY